MTGTMTGLHAPKPGETAVADFGALGRSRWCSERGRRIVDGLARERRLARRANVSSRA